MIIELREENTTNGFEFKFVVKRTPEERENMYQAFAIATVKQMLIDKSYNFNFTDVDIHDLAKMFDYMRDVIFEKESGFGKEFENLLAGTNVSTSEFSKNPSDDIRNKLGPMKNLLTMLINDPNFTQLSGASYIAKEINQCRESVEYLSKIL
jgi:hypothetical protein